MIPSDTSGFSRISKLYIIERIKRINPFFGSLGLTIGNFDGYHLGHQQIVRLLTSKCRQRGLFSAVITFKEHPLKLISGEVPKLLGSPMEKIRWFQTVGVDILFYIDFDLSILNTEPLEFIKTLQRELDPRLYCLGTSFRFGRENAGDVDLIWRQKQVLGYELFCVDDVMVADEAVSSTRIRKAVMEGNIKLANRLLGRRYTVWLRKDDRAKGHLSLLLPDTALPCQGRYAGEMLDLQTRANCKTALTISGGIVQADSVIKNAGLYYQFFFHHNMEEEK